MGGRLSENSRRLSPTAYYDRTGKKIPISHLSCNPTYDHNEVLNGRVALSGFSLIDSADRIRKSTVVYYLSIFILFVGK